MPAAVRNDDDDGAVDDAVVWLRLLPLLLLCAAGTGRPNAPLEPSPHANTAPDAVTARECRSPADSSTTM